ncbi:hypothetical protein LY28_01806 [Ruminiclostridium sufflavum DSM 19573]|uniref:Uncharacterized protein n=1 Tax=Ruminiclostridium sufflavum DSM 19573 TaxID=1121337 RepID=A0A318XK55_9FIRM|nr:hypothetical protein [Ruminiclostridium sufflavum]PYG87786.1 hypothetical protein LY28_01806 [Ruminiclostridium sufflavum DSM 19573]
MFVAIFLLIVLGSGFIAERVFSLISRRKQGNAISIGMAFSLLVFIADTIGMYLLKNVTSLAKLAANFNLAVFTSKYAFLSILAGIILASVFGIAARVLSRSKSRRSETCE